MQEEENGREVQPQEEPQPAETPESPPAAAGEGEKPRKAVPKVPKGKFKKPEKPDLAAVKGKYPKTDEGPVKKPSVERFAKKKGMDPKILGAIIGVAAILVIVYLFVGRGSSGKMDAAYLRAVKAVQSNTEAGKRYEGMTIEAVGSPSFEEYTESDLRAKTVQTDLSVTKSGGATVGGSLKANSVYYKNQWHLLYLEVTIEGEGTEVLLDKQVTEKGLQNK